MACSLWHGSTGPARPTMMPGATSRQRRGQAMAGNLSFEELTAAVGSGTIDTVLVAMVDMQGRLVGKRFQAEYFVDGAHEETHACDYLLANDIDMEPVPGYAAASWDKGYGDFVLKPDLATLRKLPWLEGTALVLADVLDHHHHDVAHSPRAMLKRQIGAACRAQRCARSGRLRTRVLPVRRDLQVGGGQALLRAGDGRRLHRGLSHPADHQGGGRDARHPPRPAGAPAFPSRTRRASGGRARKRSTCAMRMRWRWPTATSS